MRRALVVGVVVLAAIGVGLGVWGTRPQPVDGGGEPTVLPEQPVAAFTPVAVHALADQGLTLSGTVKDAAGQPIANATISLAATEQRSLTSVHCGFCQELLLSCRARETSAQIEALLAAHEGELTAATTTRSDARGRFRFEHLAGISFTVWGEAPGHGLGVKERAAPGDPVELFLPEPRRLSGVVRDEAGAPVKAIVRAVSRRLATTVTSQADESGRFTFEGLGEGPFFVQASAPGWLPGSRAEVQAGPDSVLLTLVRPRTLEARLVSSDRTPLAGTVRLVNGHLSKELAAKDGLAIISGLSPGALMVSAVSGELASAPQSVTLSEATTSITLLLEKGGRLALTVLDEQEQPVPEPTIELLTTASEPIVKRRLRTGELAVLGPIAVGDYLVRAQAEGFTAVTAPAKVKEGETALELTLTKGMVIAGKVIDEYGRAAPGVSVLISPLGESVISGADGRFRATVPSPGLFSLQAHHSDWGGGEVKVTAPTEDVTLQLEPRAGCEITVMNEGRRVEGASVVMFNHEGNFRSDRVSGADGVVLMRGLPANGYTVIATHPDYLPSERLPVKIEDGQLFRVTAEVQTGARITGQVVDTLGARVSGVSVGVMPRGTEPVISDADGAFSLGPLRPKVGYAVRVTQRGFEQVERVVATPGGPAVRVVVNRQPVFRGRVLGAGQPLKRFRVDAHEVSTNDGTFELPLAVTGGRVVVTIESAGFEPLIVDRPNTPDLGDFDLRRRPMVSGRVVDEGGSAVADAIVSCDSCEQSVTTDADGTFTLAQPPYQHSFVVVAKKGRRTGAQSVQAETGQRLLLTLKPGVRLSGRVWLSDGQPAAGVELAGMQTERNETVTAVTAADGSYSIELAPGHYRFSLVGRGIRPMELAVLAEISGLESHLDFGPWPGSGSLPVRVAPGRGYALWLVRGELSGVGNPPLELMRSPSAQMVFQPPEHLVLQGLAPGRYTLVYANFYDASERGPVVMPVDVPAPQEVNLVR